MEAITTQVFKKAMYPKETSRFQIAMIFGIPIAFLALLMTLLSFGLILIYVGLIIFFIWFGLSIAKVHLIGNSVRVSDLNFPEIYAVYQEVKLELSYPDDIQMYVVDEGSVNAILAKFFRTKFIVLNSELVKDMIQDETKLIQMKWIIGRFIGALRAKHFRTTLLKVIFESVEKIKIFNLFLLPYERATQYTGDNIGMLLTKDVEQSIAAFNKLMVGNDLSTKIDFKGLLEQGRDLEYFSFFSFMARAYSSHPHLVHRYMNLLAYASKEFPKQFDNYINEFDNATKQKLFRLLPRY